MGPCARTTLKNEQSNILVLASCEAGLSAGQDKQFADPGASLYVPISHALHVGIVMLIRLVILNTFSTSSSFVASDSETAGEIGFIHVGGC